MRNMLDKLSGREWRVWCRDLAASGEKTAQFVAEDMNYRALALPQEELRLTGLGTEITQQWAVLQARLRKNYDSRFNDEDIRDLKQEADSKRLEAVALTSYVRAKNINRRFYKPYYGRFQDMVDVQVEIWDDLLLLCETRDSCYLESVSRRLEECKWAGEDALLQLPRLIEQRREDDRRRGRRAALICIVILAAVFVLAGVCAVAV